MCFRPNDRTLCVQSFAAPPPTHARPYFYTHTHTHIHTRTRSSAEFVRAFSARTVATCRRRPFAIQIKTLSGFQFVHSGCRATHNTHTLSIYILLLLYPLGAYAKHATHTAVRVTSADMYTILHRRPRPTSYKYKIFRGTKADHSRPFPGPRIFDRG